MIKINANFGYLTPNYLFSDVARKIATYLKGHPGSEVIKMSIGDVTRPLCRTVIDALHRAVDDQADASTFRGYGPEQGYGFLAERIAEVDYRSRGINDISVDEIFISDGAKSDLGNIGDILAPDCRVAVTDPVYPVYVDTNLMAGRRPQFLPCTADNDFVPRLPEGPAPDVIYLCYPNNPTGTTLTRAQLRTWVDYALEHDALIIYDSAYEIFIRDADVPHSIYELPGARRCAIEFRSFSKTAGFTGMRCGYTVVPHELTGRNALTGESVSLRDMWLRRQTTKFNGASYPIQRAAEAIYTPQGQTCIRETADYYLGNAALLRQGLAEAGLTAYGGVNAPYLWVKTPEGIGSWEFFDLMLERIQVACTPGAGFGPSGEGYVRMTAFNTREATIEASARLSTLNIR